MLTPYQSTNISLTPDGLNYQWTYRLNMFTNPTLLITIYKVIGLTLFICWALLSLIVVFTDGLEGIWGVTKPYAVVIPIFLVLGFISYLIVALMYGGKYTVKFLLNEKEVCHIQIAEQSQKAQKMGCLLSVLGALSRHPGRVGQGMLVASHTSSTSVLKNVRSIKGRRRRHVIYVNQTLNKNQVYVADEDYEFVYDFLVRHCPNAKIK